jgi:tripartite motif-containing protein 71
MKRFLLFLAAAVMVSTVLAGFKYEGEWGELGSGPGQFRNMYGVDVAPDGNVYVADCGNNRIQYFTPTGSYLGYWNSSYSGATFDVAVAPNGNVYTGGCSDVPYYIGYDYFTKSGSLLGSWSCKAVSMPIGHGDIATNGNVYAGETDWPFCIGDQPDVIAYYTPNGSLIGSWSVMTSSYGEPGIGVSPSSTVFVALGHSIRRYTSAGSLLGSWGSSGSGNGQLRGEPDVDVAPDGRVFVADSGNNRVQYFTPTGSFLGKWGTLGTGAGEFNNPKAIAVSPDGKRVYVADAGNNRVQYFVDDTTITPTSLGRVKALFK